MKSVFFTVGLLISSSTHGSDKIDNQLDLTPLKNPVWQSKDNLRDPSVLKTQDGYRLFYSRFSGPSWSSADNWAIACVSTRDFVHFENDHDVSPKGYASPGDVVSWQGRYVLPYQSYPAAPRPVLARVFSGGLEQSAAHRPSPAR